MSGTMLRTVVPQIAKSGVAQHVRAFATPASGLATKSAPGPFATDTSVSPSDEARPSRAGVTNYWEEKRPTKMSDDAKDGADKKTVRHGVMQKLFF